MADGGIRKKQTERKHQIKNVKVMNTDITKRFLMHLLTKQDFQQCKHGEVDLLPPASGGSFK